jgi:Zn-finger nucleic acid-binding protein
VIDQCKVHGVWLDGGEITHLLEWKKAGGQILADKKQQEREQKRRRPASPSRDVDVLMDRYSKPANNGEIDLVESIAEFIFRVFQ